MKIKMLLGDYPRTHALRRGELESDLVQFDFPEEKVINKLFKANVREEAFEIGELAIATFLQAKEYGKPLVLIPAVLRGKFAHATLQYDGERSPVKPKDLEGRRVGIRAWAQTTPLWVRGVLQNDYGVDLDKVKWVTFEDSHVAELKDPPGVERALAGKKAKEMVLSGELDAAMLSEQWDTPDSRLKTVIPDARNVALKWYEKHGVVPINHVLVAKTSFSKEHPEIVAEVFRLLQESKKAAGFPKPDELDAFSFGVAAMRKQLEVAIEYALQQKLITKRFTVDELFDDNTRALGA